MGNGRYDCAAPSCDCVTPHMMPSSSQVHLCVSCRNNLARGDPDATSPPPPLAICNNWAVCPLPPIIRDMNPTWAEFSVRARAQVAIRYVVNGRGRFQMLSHNMVFLNQQPAADTVTEIKNPFLGLSGITPPGLVGAQFRQQISQEARSTLSITGTNF